MASSAPGGAEHLPEGFDGAVEQRCDSHRDALDPVRPCRGNESQQIGRQPRQVGPADDQRPVRVEQHARHLPQHPGCGDGDAGPDLDDAAVAVRAAPAGLVAVDEGDAMPVSQQREGAADADDSRADDGEMARPVRVPGHRLAGRAGQAGKLRLRACSRICPTMSTPTISLHASRTRFVTGPGAVLFSGRRSMEPTGRTQKVPEVRNASSAL